MCPERRSNLDRPRRSRLESSPTRLQMRDAPSRGANFFHDVAGAFTDGSALAFYRTLNPEEQAQFFSSVTRFISRIRREGPPVTAQNPAPMILALRSDGYLNVDALLLTSIRNVRVQELLKQYKRHIRRFGDDSIAHLCVSTAAFVHLQNKGVHTVEALRDLVDSRREAKTPGHAMPYEQELKEKLIALDVERSSTSRS
jgi:hypothetical protein